MKIKLPQNELILYAIGIFQTVRMTYALYFYEGSNNLLLQILAVLGGVCFGWAVSFALAVFAHSAPRTSISKRARQLSYVAGGLLMLISPLITAPAAYYVMPGEMEQWVRIMTSVSIAIAPDLVSLVVAALSGPLQNVEQAKPVRSGESAEPKPAKPKKAVAMLICKYGCGFERATSQALNAHYRGCKSNPANQPIPVGVMPK